MILNANFSSKSEGLGVFVHDKCHSPFPYKLNGSSLGEEKNVTLLHSCKKQ